VVYGPTHPPSPRLLRCPVDALRFLRRGGPRRRARGSDGGDATVGDRARLDRAQSTTCRHRRGDGRGTETGVSGISNPVGRILSGTLRPRDGPRGCPVRVADRDGSQSRLFAQPPYVDAYRGHARRRGRSVGDQGTDRTVPRSGGRVVSVDLRGIRRTVEGAKEPTRAVSRKTPCGSQCFYIVV